MNEAALMAARRGGLLVLQLSGELRHTLAERLEPWIEGELVAGLERLVIDLDGASFMDSTVIGMLVLAAQRAATHTQQPPLLLGTNDELWQQLVDLHLDNLFERAPPAIPPLPAPSPLPAAKPLDERAQAQLVLRAHRALVEHDPRNAESFSELIQLLEAEIGQREAGA